MSTGHVNDGVGTSKSPGPSFEEQALQSNLKLWDLSWRRREEEEEIDKMAGDDGSSSGDDGGEDEMGVEDETTTDGGDRTDAGERTDGDDRTDAGERTDGVEQTTDAGEHTDGGGKKKVVRKPRPPPMLGTEHQEFTQVSPTGAPEEPKDLVAGYGIQIGCMVRETVMINTRNLRDPANAHLVELLMEKLHRRYKFPDEYDNQLLKGNVVNQAALTKMSTALASWRGRVKKRIDKNKSWEEIKAKEPMLEHDDYMLFKETLETDTAKANSAWGKKLYELNIGHHRLGSGGYRAAQEIWDKEDAELRRLGKPNRWDRFTEPQVRNFVRACYFLCPITKEFKTEDPAVQEFEKILVSHLPRISVVHIICTR